MNTVEILSEQDVRRIVAEEREKPRFLSKAALAEYLGVKPRTIETWRAKGLPGRRVGREVMFEVDEVVRWIDREGSTTSSAGFRNLTRRRTLYPTTRMGGQPRQAPAPDTGG